ncbi:MAG TPA: endonuclease III [Candidatus Nanoarchaeia archaeon]|nr:endonuclease III [Candidatus Nanoarchaeia archaeon]
MDRTKALKQLKLLSQQAGSPRLAAENWKHDYQTLIATLLSARTRDEVTIIVAEKLFSKYKTLDALSKASITDIQKIIGPVNFFRNKSKSVIGCAKKLVSDFNGKVPHNLDLLITIPGVGRKTANVFLSETGGDAIGVDTHVHYIANYLGWSKDKNPHKVESDLKKLFPKQKWSSVNEICVKFGKTHMSRIKKNKLLDLIKNI